MVDENKDSDDEPLPFPEPEPREVLNAETLFKGRREVWIELEGVRYRLRITRRNKLILQK